jgi:hypothetical protein
MEVLREQNEKRKNAKTNLTLSTQRTKMIQMSDEEMEGKYVIT